MRVHAHGENIGHSRVFLQKLSGLFTPGRPHQGARSSSLTTTCRRCEAGVSTRLAFVGLDQFAL